MQDFPITSSQWLVHLVEVRFLNFQGLFLLEPSVGIAYTIVDRAGRKLFFVFPRFFSNKSLKASTTSCLVASYRRVCRQDLNSSLSRCVNNDVGLFGDMLLLRVEFFVLLGLNDGFADIY